MALPRSQRSAFQSAKNKENRDLGSQNPQNFLACGAASRSPGLWRSQISVFPSNATLYGELTPWPLREANIGRLVRVYQLEVQLGLLRRERLNGVEAGLPLAEAS